MEQLLHVNQAHLSLRGPMEAFSTEPPRCGILASPPQVCPENTHFQEFLVLFPYGKISLSNSDSFSRKISCHHDVKLSANCEPEVS